MYLRKMNRDPREHWHLAELELGYLAHVPHQGMRRQDSIARASLIKERPVSGKMEVTDGYWLGVVVYDVVVRILHSTRLSYTLDWWRYIFLLVIGGSGCDLKNNTH